MRSSGYGSLALCAVLAFGVAACDDNGVSGPEGTGAGTLSVAGETFDFYVFTCAFGTDETENPDVTFSLTGGDPDRDLTVSALRTIPGGDGDDAGPDGPQDNVSFVRGDPSSPEVSYQATRARVGDQVTGEFLNVGEEEVEATALFRNVVEEDPEDQEGTFQATCP